MPEITLTLNDFEQQALLQMVDVWLRNMGTAGLNGAMLLLPKLQGAQARAQAQALREAAATQPPAQPSANGAAAEAPSPGA